MKRSSALTVVVMMMMALWMTISFAHGAAAQTCEGYERKENVPESGSGKFDVMYEGVDIGDITWNNDAEPENVTWSVSEGFSLDVCVKGGDGLNTGSGQSGTLTPPQKNGQTPDVSHFAWTVNEVVVEEKKTEDKKVVEKKTEDKKVVEKETEDKKVVQKETEDEKVVQRDDAVEGESDDDEVAQVTQVPQGPASAGGGSTSGVENVALFVLGLILVAAAGLLLVFVRWASSRA